MPPLEHSRSESTTFPRTTYAPSRGTTIKRSREYHARSEPTRLASPCRLASQRIRRPQSVARDFNNSRVGSVRSQMNWVRTVFPIDRPALSLDQFARVDSRDSGLSPLWQESNK